MRWRFRQLENGSEMPDAAMAGFALDPECLQFLTTESVAQLDPTLDAYGQWVVRDYDAQGNFLGTMSHILRVYLIDQNKRIRNIYSTSFLHADTVTNDILTLLYESD